MSESPVSPLQRIVRLSLGPAAVCLLAAVIYTIEYNASFKFPNPGTLLILPVIVVALGGDVLGTVISTMLALGLTLWFISRGGLDYPTWTRIVGAIVIYPVLPGVIVTLRRRLVKAIAAPALAEHQLFEAIMASMHDAIVETDWKGIRNVNDSFCKMTGFSREELIDAKPPYPFWPPEQYATIATALETSMRGKALDFELVLTRKDGQRFPVLLSVSRILESANAASRVLYTFRDITDLKQAQDDFRESRRMLQQAIDAANLGVWHWDLQTNLVDGAGYSSDAVKKNETAYQGAFQGFLSTIHPDDLHAFNAAHEEACRNRTPFQCEFRRLRHDGGIVWVLGRGAFQYNEKGEPIRMSGVAMDITQRRTAEILRQQQASELAIAKEAADIANRTKDRFLSLLSRELRSPLTPVLSLASVLEHDTRLPESVRADMEIIRRNAEIEAHLIDDLLEFVQLAKGRLSPDADTCIRQLADNIVAARVLEPAHASSQASPEPAVLRPLKILLIEDHQDTVIVLSRLLAMRSHLVTSAATMRSALAAAAADTFDVLICDIGLPDGSGLDLMRKLQQIRPLRGIALSGLGSPEDIQRSLDAGFHEHLVKPINFQALGDAIERLTAATPPDVLDHQSPISSPTPASDPAARS